MRCSVPHLRGFYVTKRTLSSASAAAVAVVIGIKYPSSVDAVGRQRLMVWDRCFQGGVSVACMKVELLLQGSHSCQGCMHV